ncbi:uncharacterized protein BDZ83DRAFT_464425 [Colletotrichum acutatum]|uniref:Uncharacterized protein n=1 Tax=Glomerella acutata TaxID=27357 RepID=A0AAD8UHI0_GLOAC|nr:uncharacterized protein BDZ83DRAFT_464425 [Colletotrichum acutatum]KAK1719330.1 hypothetical protein BDZ83DRAFT_464425 [Colletotrichum acutatum]
MRSLAHSISLLVPESVLIAQSTLQIRLDSRNQPALLFRHIALYQSQYLYLTPAWPSPAVLSFVCARSSSDPTSLIGSARGCTDMVSHVI